jgi:uncharacterized protein (TIGR02246 family)
MIVNNQSIRRRTFGLLVLVPWTITLAAESSQSDEDAVRRVLQDIVAADNVQDIERVVSLYTADAVLLNPSGSDVVGSDAIRAHYANLFSETTFQITTRIEEVIVCDDLATVRGINEVVAIDSDSGKRTSVVSKYFVSLRRESDEQWRIARLMWSNQ